MNLRLSRDSARLDLAACAAWTVIAIVFAVWSPPVAEAAGPKPPDTTWVHIGSPEAGTRAFVALPPGQGAAPSLIVAHESGGLGPQIREVARRLSLQGYVVIVPDLYHGAEPTNGEHAQQLASAIEPAKGVKDLDDAALWLRSQPRTAKSRMGVLGFDMGSEFALDFAIDGSVSAAVLFYGPTETDPSRLAPLEAPIQGHFAAADERVPKARVDAFRSALKSAGKSAEIYIYPAAEHGFMREGGQTYHPDAARQAWARLLAFLQRTLKG